MKHIYGIAIAVVFTMAESRDWPCPAEGGSSISHWGSRQNKDINSRLDIYLGLDPKGPKMF